MNMKRIGLHVMYGILLASLAGSGASAGAEGADPRGLEFPSGKTDYFKCLLVLQGDLIEIDYYGRIEQVRLLGVRAPALRALGPDEVHAEEARRFAKGLMEGKEIYLEYDDRLLDDDRRLLAYVYLRKGTPPGGGFYDNLLVNAEMIRTGNARMAREHPFRLSGWFAALEGEARSQREGIWKSR